ncbi:Reverse transcriptase (RNA-dependent DNA polymerase) [Fragilaria crotonensis]|nr:Reverse transcriptase (RNA-dependent DNA polymerase) [Fragilaria crotonensis]
MSASTSKVEKADSTTKDKGTGEAKKKGGQVSRFSSRISVPVTKFEGACDGLKGHIYDCTDAKQADLFIKTTSAISTYVATNFSKFGADISIAVETLSLPIFDDPVDPPIDASETRKRMWAKEVDDYMKRIGALAENVRAMYSLVWGQCSDIMQQKIEACDGFKEMNRKRDGLKLLETIKNLSYQYQSQKYVAQSLLEAKKRFLNCSQGRAVTVKEYQTKFKNLYDVIKYTGGTMVDPAIEKIELGNRKKEDLSEEEQVTMAHNAEERMLAMAFIIGADKARFSHLMENLENDFLQGHDNFPTDLNMAYNLLSNWKQHVDVNYVKNAGAAGEVSFVNADAAKKDKTPRAQITCHRCRQKGHYASECDNERVTDDKPKDTKAKSQTGTTLLTDGAHEYDADFLDDQPEYDDFQFVNHDETGVAMQIGKDGRLPQTWILLDNQSTVDVFCNKRMLSNIREHTNAMDIHCNAGITSTKWIGELKGYGTVWYNPSGIANILSLSRVKEHGYRVTFDTSEGNAFHVHKSDGDVRVFSQSAKGLYYFDVGKHNKEVSLINTVADNATKYSERDYSKAQLARSVQKIIGRPSTRTFISIIEKNLLPNCPVTRDDIIAAERIFGPDIGSLKGKTVQKRPDPVKVEYTNIPGSIMSRYQKVVLAGDIMFVNKLPFFMTISRHIKFSTAELLVNRHIETIFKATKRVHQHYLKRGFQITSLLMDGEFDIDGYRGDLSTIGVTLNAVAANEHVPEIERHIRVIKERARSVVNMLPFQAIPARMIVELIYYCCFWLNSFPANGGISDTLSPRAIVVGSTINYNNHVKLEFGQYVQTHEPHNNSMQTRTVGALALRPTGNEQGGHYFFSLTTGRRLNRNHWTSVPMPAEVIERVHELAKQAPGTPMIEFANRTGVPFDEDDLQDDIIFPEDDELEDEDSEYDPNDNAVEIAGVNEDEEAEAEEAEATTDEDEIPDEDEDEDNEGDEGDDDEGDDFDFNPIGDDDDNDPIIEANEDNERLVEANEDNERLVEANDVENIEDNREDNLENIEDNLEARMDEAYGPRTSEHNLRPRKPRDYGHIHTILESTVMTQHSVKKGLKLFGEKGIDAIMKELDQLHTRKVLKPKKNLNCKERRDSLQYLMFLKEKRNGIIKARGCADGRKQREFTTKEEASSPTVAIESVMLSCAIDARERRDVATVDLPGAFMQADMEDTVHMKLEGKMAELLVRCDPKLYRKYIQIENGKEVLYVQLEKALYGTLKAALLFWRRLSAQLIKWGFELNPYDSCVANKIIDESQCTILWHVDDLKISHKDPNVVTDIITMLESEFGNEAPLTITRGKVHDYLGMTIDFSIDGKVMFTMIDYIKGMLEELPVDFNGTAPNPASPKLFDVDPNATQLPKSLATLFHHNAAKLLFLCKRARPDVQTATAFLCTRVKGPDGDDYKKLRRVMQYLRSTAYMPLTLEADDMFDQMVGGLIVCGSSRYERSSTESELVSVYDIMPQVLWTRYFLEAQGYDVKDSVIHQDNKSTILLAENGKASSSKRTRHINIRYFFVKDRIASGDVRVTYCPTEKMIADYFTKPLQGALFLKMRNEIMNINPDHVNYALEDCRSVLNMADGNSYGMTNGHFESDGGWVINGKTYKLATLKMMLRLLVRIYFVGTLLVSVTSAQDCSVCGNGYQVGSPSAITSVRFSEQTHTQYTCSDLEFAGLEGLIPSKECSDLHIMIFSDLRTQTLHASPAAGTSPSVATSSFLVGPVSAPPVAYPISYGYLPTSNIPPVAAPPAEPVAPAFVVSVFLGSFLFLFLCCLFLKALELENCPSIVPRPRNLSMMPVSTSILLNDEALVRRPLVLAVLFPTEGKGKHIACC